MKCLSPGEKNADCEITLTLLIAKLQEKAIKWITCTMSTLSERNLNSTPQIKQF
jgi:hypothetical protein